MVVPAAGFQSKDGVLTPLSLSLSQTHPLGATATPRAVPGLGLPCLFIYICRHPPAAAQSDRWRSEGGRRTELRIEGREQASSQSQVVGEPAAVIFLRRRRGRSVGLSARAIWGSRRTTRSAAAATTTPWRWTKRARARPRTRGRASAPRTRACRPFPTPSASSPTSPSQVRPPRLQLQRTIIRLTRAGGLEPSIGRAHGGSTQFIPFFRGRASCACRDHVQRHHGAAAAAGRVQGRRGHVRRALPRHEHRGRRR